LTRPINDHHLLFFSSTANKIRTKDVTREHINHEAGHALAHNEINKYIVSRLVQQTGCTGE